jgi:hypothetical protein
MTSLLFYEGGHLPASAGKHIIRSIVTPARTAAFLASMWKADPSG